MIKQKEGGKEKRENNNKNNLNERNINNGRKKLGKNINNFEIHDNACMTFDSKIFWILWSFSTTAFAVTFFI